MFIAELAYPEFATTDNTDTIDRRVSTVGRQCSVARPASSAQPGTASCSCLSILGRSKDMVIRGGENIYPRAVEVTGKVQKFKMRETSVAELALGPQWR